MEEKPFIKLSLEKITLLLILANNIKITHLNWGVKSFTAVESAGLRVTVQANSPPHLTQVEGCGPILLCGEVTVCAVISSCGHHPFQQGRYENTF